MSSKSYRRRDSPRVPAIPEKRQWVQGIAILNRCYIKEIQDEEALKVFPEEWEQGVINGWPEENRPKVYR